VALDKSEGHPCSRSTVTLPGVQAQARCRRSKINLLQGSTTIGGSKKVAAGNPVWPQELFDLVFIPHMDERLDELADIAEPEEWAYQHTQTNYQKPVLYNYIQHTYSRLAEEDKIMVSDDGQLITFNTGLVTPNQEPIFAVSDHNHLPNALSAVAGGPLKPGFGLSGDVRMSQI
jgi:hypothetical protein